jgi:hypothetical protein
MTDEVWDSIVESFADDSGTAFILAQLLFEFKEQIKKGRGGAVAEELDRGIERLYPYTDEYKAALLLFQLAVAGNLKPKHDPKVIVAELGAKK